MSIRLAIVVAKSDNDVIGVDNALPWHLPQDLKRFKEITMGHPMIMGRLTYESIGKPLPGRKTIVVSSQSLDLPSEVTVVSSLEAAIDEGRKAAEAMGVNEVMVVGGAQIYQQLLPKTSRLYVTEVHTSLNGDAFFPNIDTADWVESSRARNSAENMAYSFVTYDRNQ